MARRGENIYKRKDGRYEGRYVIGRTGDGRTKFGYIYGRQYLTVRNALIRKKAALLGNGGSGCEKKMTVACWMESWLENEQRARVKPSSYNTYLNTYRKHIKPHLGGIPICQLTPVCIQDFLDTLRSSGLAPATVKGVHRLLSSGLKYAQEEGLILKNPCKKIVLDYLERSQQPILNVEEQKRVCNMAMERSDIPTLMGLYTGMRLGEICALKWSDINWQQRTVTIRRTVQRVASDAQTGSRTALSVGLPKSMHSCRTLPVPEFILNLLKEQMADTPSNYIFGYGERAAEPRTIQRRFQRLLKASDVSNAHFHTLRHSFATRLLELGIDVKTVSALLGHSSTRITLDFYAHSLPGDQQRAVDLLVQQTR